MDVRRSQERVIKVNSLSHLRTLVEDAHGRLEHGILLALHGAPGSDCMEKLVTQLRFPFPFAGWSDGALRGRGMWWEDVMQCYAARYDEATDLKELFGAQSCPSIIFAKKGSSLHDYETVPPDIIERGRFTEWNMWMEDRLQTTITIRNHLDAHMQLFFGFGYKIFKFSVIPPGQDLVVVTTISHEWVAVDSKLADSDVSTTNSQRFFVTGWHNQEFDILATCASHHDECKIPENETDRSSWID